VTSMSEREETKRCPDCGSEEAARHTFEECCAILREQRDEARRERDALDRELQDVRETYDRTIDHLSSDVTYERHRDERAERVVEAARFQAVAKRAWFTCGHSDPNCDHYHTYLIRCADTEQAVYAHSTAPTRGASDG